MTLVAAAVVFGLLPAPRAHAIFFGSNACYEIGDSGEYIRYVATPLGMLTTFQEYREFNHAIQKVYSVHGKATFGTDGAMGHVNGTITVERDDDAVLSFQTDFFQPPTIFIKRMCASIEASPTPSTWECRGILVRTAPNSNEVIPTADGGITTFYRRDPLLHESCSEHITPIDIEE